MAEKVSEIKELQMWVVVLVGVLAGMLLGLGVQQMQIHSLNERLDIHLEILESSTEIDSLQNEQLDMLFTLSNMSVETDSLQNDVLQGLHDTDEAQWEIFRIILDGISNMSEGLDENVC